MMAVFRGLFALPLGVNGRLCSMISSISSIISFSNKGRAKLNNETSLILRIIKLEYAVLF